MSRKGYEKYEYGERHIRDEMIEQITALFKVDARALFSEARTTPVVGYVGAGAEIHLFSEGQGELDRVSSPEYATEETVAVLIRGESLGAVFEGWYAFFDERHTPPLDTDIGELCVVELRDGRVLIKKLARGNLYGRFNLLSQFGPPVYDAEVVWAARVTGLQPPR